MRASAVSGLIFANSHDDVMATLTDIRSMASVPFGGRYRLIDFSLSNFVNAGISNIGIIAKENYRSLMDHIGSGIYWDLDRKSGGVRIMPPFNTGANRRYHGHIEALYGAVDFLERCNSEYIVISEAGIVANIDISAVVETHIQKNADITVVSAVSESFKNTTGAMLIKKDENSKIKNITVPVKVVGKSEISIGLFVFKRDVLLQLVKSAYSEGAVNLELDIIAKNLKYLNVFAFKYDGYFAVMNGPESYKTASFDLLRAEVRKELFNPERPIYTKTRDDMPTRYGTKSNVNNSFIADGCVIDGTVKNSILFRGVTVKKDAVVENAILMQGVSVGKNSKLSFVVSDKNSKISDDMSVKGTKQKSFFIAKNQNI